MRSSLSRVATTIVVGLLMSACASAATALRESRERVRGAIRNAGFVHPARRITVNLAPAGLTLMAQAATTAPGFARSQANRQGVACERG